MTMPLDIKNFQCPWCGGPLIALRGSVGRKGGVLLACKDTFDGPNNCPDATGICSDIQEALGYLLPDPVEASQEVAELLSSAPRLQEQVKLLREAANQAIACIEDGSCWIDPKGTIERLRAAIEATKGET